MWALILPAVAGAALAGYTGGLLGVAALRLRLSALGYAMAHAAFAGAALGLLVGFSPLAMAVIFALVVAALVGPVAEHTGLPVDTVLALLFPLTMALGFLFMALTPGLPLTSPALTLLWGSLLGVTWHDVGALAGIGGAVTLFLLLLRREVWAVLVERKLAEEAGIRTSAILWTLLFLVGAGVATSLRLVGGLLVYALLFLPASAADRLAFDLRRQFLLAPALGVAASLGGLALSFFTNLPVGTCIALVACALFLGAWAVSPRKRLTLTPASERRPRQ